MRIVLRSGFAAAFVLPSPLARVVADRMERRTILIDSDTATVIDRQTGEILNKHTIYPTKSYCATNVAWLTSSNLNAHGKSSEAGERARFGY